VHRYNSRGAFTVEAVAGATAADALPRDRPTPLNLP
jgi:hypothetical protein